MDSRGLLVVVEPAGRDHLAGSPGVVCVAASEVARGHGGVDEGQYPLRGVELTPGRRRFRRHRPTSDVELTVETGGWTAEFRCPAIVHPGECSAEGMGRGRRRRRRGQPLQGDVLSRHVEHCHHRCPGGAEPAQSGRFRGEEIGMGARASFDEFLRWSPFQRAGSP